ncbi:MAG: recombinase family protein [Candidatus Paceibacterota bacterium]
MTIDYADLTKEEKKVKHVAVYGRKSRGDGDEDLDKHFHRMEATCKTYHWSYEVYKEIKTGNSIDDLPILNALLDEIESGAYDGLLVIDQDRLTRGGSSDQQKIMYILKKSNTVLITSSPYQIFDPTNESHEDMLMFKSMTSQLEYRMIRKRFITGKKISQNMGNWVYGSAPFGYEYNRKTKRLKIDEEEGKIVRRIVDEFFEGYLSVDIAWRLNKDGIPTKRNANWSDAVIRTILKNETYTGCTIFNKTQGTPDSRTKNKYSISNPFKYNPKDKWMRIENTHEELKTKEEHDKIMAYFNEANKNQIGKRKKLYALSGLCKTLKGETYTIRKMDKGGNILRVRSKEFMELPTAIVEDAIQDSIKLMQKRLESHLKEKSNKDEEKYFQGVLSKKENELDKLLESIERVMEGFTGGLYTLDKAKELKHKKEVEQAGLEDEIKNLRKKIKDVSNIDNMDRKARLEKFIDDIEKGFNEETRNKIYKEMINSIVVSRESRGKIDIEVNFL